MAMLILRIKSLAKPKPQEGVIAMTKGKVQNKKQQIKLVFGEGVPGDFDLDRLMEELGLELRALSSAAGVLIMTAFIEQERDILAGRRHNRTESNTRWGKQKGYVIAGGQKVGIDRPRLRDEAGKEVSLKSYARFQEDSQRTQAVFQRLVSGLSCRNYPQAIETLREGYGISKSVISREMVDATGKQLKELCERDLSEFNLCALVIDGVKLGESVHIVALGVEATGKKAVMGFREGSTENADVCVALFEDMVRRGLKTKNAVLVAIDGSKALRSAVDRFFGTRASVQRCQVHKRRNVKQHLPDKYHAEYDRKMLAAYKMATYTDAKAALESVGRELDRLNPDAAASLREGLEETLTLHRLEIPVTLRISFSSTNLIESAFSRGRTVMRNVKRWMNSEQRHRWIATALLESEKRFRRVKGCRSIVLLVNALDLERQRKESKLESNRRVA
jgi:putative transposase